MSGVRGRRRGLLAGAALLAAVMLAPGLAAQVATDTIGPDSIPDPVEAYVKDLADPLAAATALALGLYDHARVEPEEWGGGLDALTQRVASRAGGHVIGTSVRHGLAAALGRSTVFEPCGCTGTSERINHALLETFTDRDLDTGERVLSEPFLAGTVAGAMAPVLWHPDAELGDGLRAAVLSVAFTTAGRVLFALLDPGP